MESSPKISIIIPAYNEALNIGKVIDETKANISEADIIVVNDASEDSTSLVAKTKGVDVISHVCNLGIGGAVQTGFKYACEREYDIAVQVDADGQHNPQDISKLVEPIVNGEADVVIGSRYIKKSGFQTSLARRLGMFFFGVLTSIIVKKRITDTTSGFRAANREAMEFLAKEYPIDFPDAETIIILHYAGFRVKEIPIKIRERFSGKSSTNLLKSFYYPFKVMISIIAVLLMKKPRR